MSRFRRQLSLRRALVLGVLAVSMIGGAVVAVVASATPPAGVASQILSRGTVTEDVVRSSGRAVPAWPTWRAADPGRPASGSLRGLFSGGTLCDEAMVIASAELGEVRSNIPLRADWALGPDLRSAGHLMVDFGDDALTQGRAHPMIDQRTRLDRIDVEAADPGCSVLLLDVVLGHGAHPDPASELSPALADARSTAAADGRDLAVVVSLCATEADPQGARKQAEALHEAGAAIFLSNAAAARRAVALVRGAS